MSKNSQAEHQRLQDIADRMLRDNRDSGIVELYDLEPDDDEIIGLVMATYDMPKADAVDRLARIDFVAMRTDMAA